MTVDGTDPVSANSNQPAAKGGGKKILYASIALNLLLGGALLGGIFAGHRHHEGRMRPPEIAMRDIGGIFMRELPPQSRRAVMTKVRANWAEIRPLVAESMRAREAVFSLLKQEKLDIPELRSALAKAREADARAQAHASDVFSGIVESMPADERRATAARVRERLMARDRHHFEGKKHHGDGPPPADAFP